jgi:hypothetical protein
LQAYFSTKRFWAVFICIQLGSLYLGYNVNHEVFNSQKDLLQMSTSWQSIKYVKRQTVNPVFPPPVLMK